MRMPSGASMVPDRLDVAALQAEDAVDAARLQEARDPGGAGVQIGVEVDRAARCVAAHRSASAGRAVQLGLEDPMQDLAGGGARHLLVADEASDRGRL